MRDLHASELGFVYGAGGGGKSNCGGGNKHSTRKHHSKKHSTRGHSGGSKRCH